MDNKDIYFQQILTKQLDLKMRIDAQKYSFYYSYPYITLNNLIAEQGSGKRIYYILEFLYDNTSIMLYNKKLVDKNKKQIYLYNFPKHFGCKNSKELIENGYKFYYSENDEIFLPSGGFIYKKENCVGKTTKDYIYTPKIVNKGAIAASHINKNQIKLYYSNLFFNSLGYDNNGKVYYFIEKYLNPRYDYQTIIQNSTQKTIPFVDIKSSTTSNSTKNDIITVGDKRLSYRAEMPLQLVVFNEKNKELFCDITRNFNKERNIDDEQSKQYDKVNKYQIELNNLPAEKLIIRGI